MRSRFISAARALGVSLALTAALGGTAATQTFASSSYAECITGSEIGCQQVDFFFTLLSDPASATIDQFTISLLGEGWFFSAVQGGEATDFYGDNFFVGAVSPDGLTLDGTFAPGFEALVQPDLRIRAQFDNAGDFTSTASLSYRYSLRNGNEIVAAGQVPVGEVVPEPVSMVLLGTGLAGVAASRRRRRRPVPDDAV